MSSHRKRRRTLNIPPPTVTRDFRSDLDQPFHRPLDLFSHEIELSERVEEIVGQAPHE